MKDSQYYIQQRKEGRDTLSWIENFGLHLFDEDCSPRVSFKNDERNEVLVLRIDKNKNTISAYYCFFQTDGKGFTRFCVNKYNEDDDAGGLKELMDRAKWDDNFTKEYWKEVFCGGKIENVDEDTLKRPETKTSPSENLNLMEYIECIQEEIKKVIEKLSIPKYENIRKVLIAEQYAAALPLKYALSRIFANAETPILHFIKKIEKKTWQRNAVHFHVSGKLLSSELNTTPQMTIGDVLSLREKGVTFTLPLSKDQNGKYCLPVTPIIKDGDLKWSELIKEDVECDYKVGDISFKRIQLSMISDGFRILYVMCNKIVVEGLMVEKKNDKYKIKSLFLNKSEETQKPISSKPNSNETKSFPKTIADSSQNTSTNSPSEEARHQIATMFFDGSDRLITVARKNIETLFKKIYQDKWEVKMKETFCTGIYKNLDFGNFPSFITDNKDLLTEYWGGADSYYQVKNSAYALHRLRNKNSHHEIDAVINQGKAEVSRVFSDMIRVVKIMSDIETAKKIEDLNLKLDTTWWIN